IIIDEDLGGDGGPVDLEVAVSEIDDALNNTLFDGEPLRTRVDLIAEGSRIRGADDVFKLVGLGANAVGLSTAMLIALDYGERFQSRFDPEKTRENLECFFLGLQKEIKLLAGSAGVSSIQTSLIGGRELFRAVDMDPAVRRRLKVKHGGEG
ncbi:MAG: glutamate synthase-related protein, partial [Candidatus Bathyarchaeia archaeon]